MSTSMPNMVILVKLLVNIQKHADVCQVGLDGIRYIT